MMGMSVWMVVTCWRREEKGEVHLIGQTTHSPLYEFWKEDGEDTHTHTFVLLPAGDRYNCTLLHRKILHIRELNKLRYWTG